MKSQMTGEYNIGTDDTIRKWTTIYKRRMSVSMEDYLLLWKKTSTDKAISDIRVVQKTLHQKPI